MPFGKEVKWLRKRRKTQGKSLRKEENTIKIGFPCPSPVGSWVLYMSFSFWLLGVESRDFSQAEKETTGCKAEEIHKMTTIFTQNDNLGPF